MMTRQQRTLLLRLCASLLLVGATAFNLTARHTSHAQDAREALGPKDAPGGAKWKKGPHPLTRLMAERNSTLRAELRGKHPRVYVTGEEIEALRTRARTTHKDIWLRALQDVRALKREPPPAPAQARRAQTRSASG